MAEFKDKIRAAGGKVEFQHTPQGGITLGISGFGLMALYLVAVSLDDCHLLATVPAMGIGQSAIYPKPSLITYIQSDEQKMWGRNCPVCEKYFRTDHIMGITFCPYCAIANDSLAFISKDQRKYIQAYYDAYMRAYMTKQDTSLDAANITDDDAAWHYAEEKLQTHFECGTKDCATRTDILGTLGYCPRCGKSNARKLFFEDLDGMVARLETVRQSVPDRKERGGIWEEMTKDTVTKFEALGKHLRHKLLLCPMTRARRKEVMTELSFQVPFEATTLLTQWFDIGLLKWPGDKSFPQSALAEAEFPFIKLMFQKRHVLTHGGIVDEDYIQRSGDSDVRLGERISVSSKETKRFIADIRAMGEILINNVEEGLHGGDW
jgi:hypothetical protein